MNGYQEIKYGTGKEEILIKLLDLGDWVIKSPEKNTAYIVFHS